MRHRLYIPTHRPADIATLPKEYKHIAPDGAEVRELLDNAHGGIAHCILHKGKISNPVKHQTVSEFWYILASTGEIWRSQADKEVVVKLSAGVAIDLPAGTVFQYCSFQEDLIFLCITTPPWPGPAESIDVAVGKWQTISA